ncbi:hypothetical protein L7F22_011817 [Adiantum nelumboides]|nr:hypothetical protein [Adiantum nelumboides]
MKPIIGVVLSNKMQKSVVVASYHFWEDTVHKKKVQRRTKLMAHDENNECNIGDWVILFFSFCFSTIYEYTAGLVAEGPLVELLSNVRQDADWGTRF